MQYRQPAERDVPPPLSSLSPEVPEFLIVSLFALRLTKQLIGRLGPYPSRDTDIDWLNRFLTPYRSEHALARVSGAMAEDYVATYPGVVSRMKMNPRYPMTFMRMNPDRSRGQNQNERLGSREMTDAKRLEIIDFCDAASEWGSIVPIPANEADHMIALAEQRQVADLGDGPREHQEHREPPESYTPARG